MLTINNTKETLPFNNINVLYTNVELAQTLNIPHKYPTKEEINAIPSSYPAYTALMNNAKKINSNFLLLPCLYSNTEILFNVYPQYTVTDFDSFYSYARSLLSISYDHKFYFHDHNTCSIYNFLNLVECIKNVENLSCEKDMYYKILNFDPTQTYKGIILKFFNKDYATVTTKNFIAILYTLAEKYNQARGNKKIPTGKQYNAYFYQKELDIALPDNFDASLFDKKIYAFTEFKQLENNVRTLMKASTQDIQQCVNQLYSQ
jgi:hypothetical protein